MNEPSISIETPSLAFDNHISIENNNRILFSGPFGIGKTTFINKYFSERNQYTCITLRPVNYTVASNEDIYKLIKYDILYQLLQKNLIEVEDFGAFSKLEIASHFFATAELSQITPFIKSIPKIGGTLANILEGLNNLYHGYKTFQEKANENVDEKRVLSFLNDLEENYYLLENDFITEIIKATINRINNTEGQKGVVLIIDDLDRIDPEHIFRLFNIFSTHFDYNNEQDNKFGFYRVVFVCDINNIKSIFKTKYGLNTDFNGYIDKFYSTKVFVYNNQLAITEFITSTFNVINSNWFNKRDINFLIEILSGMLEYQVTNLRNIQKGILKNDQNKINDIFNQNKIKESKFGDLHFTRIGMLLSYLIGNTNLLIDLLEKCKIINDNSKNRSICFHQSYISDNISTYLISVCFSKEHNFAIDNRFYVDYHSMHHQYQFKKDGYYYLAKPLGTMPQFPEGSVWHYLLESVITLRDNNII